MIKTLTTISLFFICLSINSQVTKLEWSKQFSGIRNDNVNSMVIDNYGNIFTIGSFSDSVDFDPGAGTSYLVAGPSESAMFITKLDSSGNFIWAKKIAGTSTCCSKINPEKILLDTLGNIYLTGYFYLIIDFDPSIGVATKSSIGFNDVFVLKLDSTGSFLWVKTFGGSFTNYGKAVAVDRSGNVYATGSYEKTTDFDPNSGVYNLVSNGYSDIFITKLNSSGDFVWAKSFGSTGYDYGYDISTDSYGNIFAIGAFKDTVDFDPGVGVSKLISGGSSLDIYILKFDTAGNYLWAGRYGSGADDDFAKMTLDANSNILITGYFYGTVDFDPGAGVANLTATNLDIYILKLNVSGNFIWAKKIGASLDDIGNSITTDSSGNIYTTGSFQRTVDFNPNAGVYNLASYGLQDIFILKLDPNGNFVWAKSTGSSTVEEGKTIGVNKYGSVYASGYFSGTVDFDPNTAVRNLTSSGGTDVFLQKFVNCQPTSSTQSASACLTYTLNGQTYTASGIYTQIISNASGCDSIITLNLNIKNATSASIFPSACKSYTINNKTYTTSGTYTQTLTNSLGCDSILTIQLTINNANTSVSKLFNTLTANASGAIYQWVTCPSYAIIPGATSQTFTPTVNGNYAVIVKQFGCFDTSTCQTINQVGLNKSVYMNMQFSIYPNPVNQLFNIDFTQITGGLKIQIFNDLGVQVYFQSQVNEHNTIKCDYLPTGIYSIRILNDNIILASQKLIKL